MVAKAVEPRTNGDRIAPAVDRAKRSLAEGVRWAKENPDEVLVAVAPSVAVAWATRRHPLTTAEDFILFEAGYWLGQAALQHYRQWKTRPARPLLKEVV